MNYYWLQTGNLTAGHMAIWLTLVCITGLITLFSVRSVAQALQPLQALFERSGASLHADRITSYNVCYTKLLRFMILH